MTDPFARSTAAVFRRLGVSATYTPAGGGTTVPITAIPEPAQVIVGDNYQQVAEERMAISVQVADVAKASRGATIAVTDGPYSGNTYTVARRESTDGYSARYIMNEQP